MVCDFACDTEAKIFHRFFTKDTHSVLRDCCGARYVVNQESVAAKEAAKIMLLRRTRTSFLNTPTHWLIWYKLAVQAALLPPNVKFFEVLKIYEFFVFEVLNIYEFFVFGSSEHIRVLRVCRF